MKSTTNFELDGLKQTDEFIEKHLIRHFADRIEYSYYPL